MSLICLLKTTFLVTVFAREAEKIDHALDDKMMEDPEFKKSVEEHMMELNKKYGVADGDMHGVEDDLDMGFDDEKINDEYDSDEFKKQMEEEMKKINSEYGLDEDQMHGLDDETADYNFDEEEMKNMPEHTGDEDELDLGTMGS